MLLLYVLTLVTLGSSFSLREDVCYGSKYRLPTGFTPPLYNRTITYTPEGGVPKIVINHGKSLDTRFRTSRGRAEMVDIDERDENALISLESKITLFGSVQLRVRNCRSSIRRRYGSSMQWSISNEAEYLEFVKHTGSGLPQPGVAKIIWNRTDPSSAGDTSVAKTLRSSIDSRFKTTNSYFAIEGSTPEDAGMYEFFDKEGNLMLIATVHIREVESVWPSYASIIGGISFGGMLCSCCMKYCCCNESSDKTEDAEEEAAAPNVNNQNPAQSTQTSTPLLPREPTIIIPGPPTYNAEDGPMYPPPSYAECVAEPSAPLMPAYSSEPKNPPVSAEPSENPPEPPQHYTMTDVNPSSLDQVSIPGATGTFSSSNNFNFTASDSEPTFEFSGTTFPSAPPLSSEVSSSIEYNSDKLNFL
ncbi:hypothetical protein WMY93_009686 [Mugilogobius chulae]|uniref:Reelin domain-containing protein n=1 Tax=Mugilogobius chulae TaxID=88201 RepID=A0AAW0PQV0_9GOBI